MVTFHVSQHTYFKYNVRWGGIDRVKVLEWIFLGTEGRDFDRITSQSATMGYAVSPRNRLEFEEVGVPIWGY